MCSNALGASGAGCRVVDLDADGASGAGCRVVDLDADTNEGVSPQKDCPRSRSALGACRSAT